MSKLQDRFHLEFEKLISLNGVKKEFVCENEFEIKNAFKFIFLINYLKNKIETKRFFSNEFNMTFSLLLESKFALITGQCRATLLLLRSALESNFKFVLERERQYVLDSNPQITFETLDHRFSQTKRKFANDLQMCLDVTKYKEYYDSLERSLSYYKKLSSIVHSGSSYTPVMSVEYFAQLYEDTIIDKEKFFELIFSVLNLIFLLIFFMVRASLIKWDYYELYNLLRIAYGDKRTKSLIRIIKEAT